MKTISKIKKGMVLLTACLSLFVCGCSSTNVDYESAKDFETALNNGENLEGVVVSFEVEEINANATLGYTIWAGEHLNFIFSENPDVEENETVTVKVNSVSNVLGSWVIQCEVV